MLCNVKFVVSVLIHAVFSLVEYELIFNDIGIQNITKRHLLKTLEGYTYKI